MVQFAFLIRFKHQLQRTRPELIPQLEEIATRAIKKAGGKIKGSRNLIQAQFDENSPGFWIDMLLLVESLTKTMEGAAVDLYGYSILLGMTLPDMPDSVCRNLAGGVKGGGIFLDQAAARALLPYITIEPTEELAAGENQYGIGTFSRLKEIKTFVPSIETGSLLWKSSISLSYPEQQPAILATHQFFEGKRDKLYLRAASYASAGDDSEFPLLFVRFGYGGLNAVTDSLCQTINLQTMGQRSDLLDSKEIADDWKLLFRQRLSDTPSPFAIRTARRFFESTLNYYVSLTHGKGKTPIVVIENIHAAEQAAADIVIESLSERKYFLLVGTCSGALNTEDLARWKPLFPQLPEINTDEESQQELANYPLELWEIGYTCSLLGQYFPPDLFPLLFEEMGKSASMFSRAISLLYAFGVIDTPLDPRPWRRDFQQQAEAVLGERTKDIRALVRSRLLAWVAEKKIDPCFGLLEILKNLDDTEEINDNLILRSLYYELAGTNMAKRTNIWNNETLEDITGPSRAPILSYIVDTSLALYSDNADIIQTAFTQPVPDCSSSPLFKTQALLNQSLYHLSLQDSDSTIKLVKEAILLCQKSSGAQVNACLAQAYRLFALANLVRQRVGETVDYLGYALENALKSGDPQDIGMAAYYNASVQLIYGNLSRSKLNAEKAHQHFLKAGNPEWADRARFLEGRYAFEIGSYQQAIDYFEDIRENPEGDKSPEKIHMLEAWVYRAKAYSQSSHNTVPQGNGYDTKLFELEALCLAGEHPESIYRSMAYTGNLPEKDFLRIEQPDWRSGFAQCELLCSSWTEQSERMLCIYYSLAGNEDAIAAMRRMLRSGQFPEFDPCDAFYHYAWYRVLEQTGAKQVDINTAVSAAFKRLQGRTARIDDIEIRRLYLTQPYWNKALAQTARKFKLI